MNCAQRENRVYCICIVNANIICVYLRRPHAAKRQNSLCGRVHKIVLVRKDAAKMTNRQKNPLLYKVIRTIFYALFMAVYRPRIVNKSLIPKEGRAVLAGNHKHALDPILVDCCTNRTVHTLAKKDLHDGAFGWLFRGVGTIPVDLHAAHNPAALDKSVEYLKNDCIINVSPEAKRNYTDQILLPFKYGAVVMAKRTQSRIIPYAITGDYRFRSRNLQIKFGEPLDVTALTVEEANTLLYNTVKELLVQEMDIPEETHADGSD